MFVITGHVQHYAWGVPGGLNRWLPTAENHDQPQAELWFGAHPNGPSPLVGSAGNLAEAASSGEVPLLVKILAARSPLSIQVHPAADLAARWFDEGSELVADPYAKEEMLVALEGFAVFAGWRPPSQSAQLLRRAAVELPAEDSCVELLRMAAQALDERDIRTAVRALLAIESIQVANVTGALRAAHVALGWDMSGLASHDLAAATFPGDNGLLVLHLLDHRVLDSHAAVYMPVGGAHAYAKGVGLEVMTASDNVLRLGLTRKRVALDQALEALRDDGDPHFLSGESQVHLGRETRVEYQPEGAPFHLTLLEAGEITLATGNYRCVLNLQGEATVVASGRETVLAPGQACVALAGEPDVLVTATGLTASVSEVSHPAG